MKPPGKTIISESPFYLAVDKVDVSSISRLRDELGLAHLPPVVTFLPLLRLTFFCQYKRRSKNRPHYAAEAA
jgi:hypothetical protein